LKTPVSSNTYRPRRQKGSNIVEVEITSPGAICGECGRDDGAKDPIYDFQRGIMIISLWCGHEYELELPAWRRVS